MGRESLRTDVAFCRSRGDRIVFTNGCFDLLHSGHVIYLEEAKRLGDRLIVAVNSDESVRRLKGPGRPIMGQQDRALALAGLESVDYVVVFAEDTPELLLQEVAPDVLAKGGDYRPHEVVGREIVESSGGRVVTVGLVDGVSTTEIISRICLSG